MCTHRDPPVRTGVFSLKVLITLHRCVRFMNHRSLKPEIFPTPVNKPRDLNTYLYLASFMQLPSRSIRFCLWWHHELAWRHVSSVGSELLNMAAFLLFFLSASLIILQVIMLTPPRPFPLSRDSSSSFINNTTEENYSRSLFFHQIWGAVSAFSRFGRWVTKSRLYFHASIP